MSLFGKSKSDSAENESSQVYNANDTNGSNENEYYDEDTEPNEALIDEDNESVSQDTDEDYIEYVDDYDATDVKPPKRNIFKYPRVYFDPCDIVLNKNEEEEYYFNLVKTLYLWHLGWVWTLIPAKTKDKILDWVWKQDALHNYSIKQHEKAEWLNGLKASEQLAHDIKILLTKLAVIIALLVGFFSYKTLVYDPTMEFNNATTLMSTGHYQEAKEIYKDLQKFKNAHVYSAYCSAQLLLKDKKYDDAYQVFEKLVPYSSILNKNMEDFKKECVFQKALSYYNEEDWERAIETIIPIIKYKNSIEYYEKSMYQIAESKYEEDDYYGALENFIKIASFDDVQDRMNALLSNLYNQGIVLYNEGKYFEAADIFNSIVDYSYKDSAQMSTQCFYELSQEKFKEGDYLEAKKLFEQIPHYKDSQTMIKECLYRSLDTNDYSKNILRMLSLVPYRDVSTILNEAPYNIYAEWIIITYNGKAANNETFIFDTDGKFICSESRLPALAISNDDQTYPYSWNGEYFSTRDSKYQIYIEDYELSDDFGAYITLKCISDDSEVIYRCQKINELDEYYSDSLVPNMTDTSDYDLIEMYLAELKKQKSDAVEDTPSNNSETDISISPEEPSPETSNETSSEEQPEAGQQKGHMFDATIIKVYEDALLVSPDPDFEESTLSDQFFVSYDNAKDLAPLDVCQITYTQDIDTNITPYEIVADKVSFLYSKDEDEESSDEETTIDSADTQSDSDDSTNSETPSAGFFY